MAVLSDTESKARDMIEESRERDRKADVPNWDVRQQIRITFQAAWSRALTVGEVSEIGRALTGFGPSVETVQRELTALTRAKLLRSYENQGRRLYELNY